MKRAVLVLISAVASFALLSACAAPAAPAQPAGGQPAPAKPAQTKKISIATGNIGGIWYPLGGGMAALMSKYIPGIEATAEVTQGSPDNMNFLRDGKSEVVFINADVGYEAYQGTGAFAKAGKVAVRSLFNMYPNLVHLVATKDSGIKTVPDLKGKRVSTAQPASGSEVNGLRLLEAYGIDPDKDLGRRERLGPAEAASAMKDRKLDAYFWTGGVPGAAILDLQAAPGMSLVMVPTGGDAIKKQVEKYGPVYYESKIPKGSYTGVDVDVPVTAMASLLAVREDMDENLAYSITKLMFERKPELVQVHKQADDLNLEAAVTGSPWPYHPGAIKYYKEKGVWKQ